MVAILLVMTATLITMIVCQIMVLIRLFQNKGLAWGLFGLFCGIYTFIWGWQNAARFNIKNLMLLWSIAIVAYIVLSFVSGLVSIPVSPTTN
jgi:hypothetical protein